MSDDLQDLEGALRIAAVTPSVLVTLLLAVPGPWLEPSPGGAWGAREIVEHLIDTESVAFVERIRRIIEEPEPGISSIDPSGRLAEAGYGERPLADLLDEFARRRADDIAWVRRFSDQELDRTGNHDVAGTISARQLVHYWATHDLVHLSQLTRAIRGHLEPHIGSMVAFLED